MPTEFDLLGPMQLGAQMRSNAEARAMERERIAAEARRLTEEIRQTQALEAYRRQQMEVAQAQENRLRAAEEREAAEFLKREMFAKSLASRLAAGDRLGAATGPGEVPSLSPWDGGVSVPAPRDPDEEFREAFLATAGQTGAYLPNAITLAGQEAADRRAAEREAQYMARLQMSLAGKRETTETLEAGRNKRQADALAASAQRVASVNATRLKVQEMMNARAPRADWAREARGIESLILDVETDPFMDEATREKQLSDLLDLKKIIRGQLPGAPASGGVAPSDDGSLPPELPTKPTAPDKTVTTKSGRTYTIRTY